MAVLTANELAALRRDVARDLATVNFSKVEVNAALQGVEDWFELNRASLSTAINTATTPFVFSAAQKKLLVAYWLLLKAGKEKV